MNRTPVITVAPGGLITVAGFTCRLGKVVRQTVDVAGRAGETVRIWLDDDRKLSTDPRRDHHWQLAELVVPAQRYTETEAKDGEGKAFTVREPIPIDLADVEIKVWSLPE